jgi:CHAT domain-containing protein/tetratricopeptide (TPR) repeat protein
MLVATLLALLLLALQQHEVQVHPGFSLHRFVVLEAGGEVSSIEITTDFEGMLHVWAQSEELDPTLSLLSERGETVEDDNTGGGTTAYTLVSVQPGQRWTASVVPGDVGRSGVAEVHWVASPETAETRAAVSRALQLKGAAVTARSEGELDGARELVREVLEGFRNAEGSELSNAVAETALDVGYLAYDLGDVPTCSDLMRFFLDHREQHLPPNHENLITARGNHAAMMMLMGDLKGARALQESVLRSTEALLPDDHPRVLSAQLQLGTTTRMMGDLREARALEEAVVEARGRLLPEDHPSLLLARSNLATTMFDQGDLAGARSLFEAVLASRRRLLPVDHPELLQSMANLASTMVEMGDPAGARPLQEAVLAAMERLLPEESADLVMTRMNLAGTMKRTGDFAAARALEEAVLETWGRLLPEDHPYLLTARQSLAATLAEMGELADARVLFEAVLEARERLLPEGHPLLIAARGNLAGTMYRAGDGAGARALEEAVLAASEAHLSDDHPYILVARMNLAAAMKQMGDHAGARAGGERLAMGILKHLESLALRSPREVREAAASDAKLVSAAAFLSEPEGSGDASPIVFSLIETWRHIASAPVFASAATDSASVDDREAVREMQRRLGDLVAGGTESPDSPEKYAEHVAEVSAERDRLERELRARLAARGVRAEPIVSDAVAASLDEGHVAIGFRRLQGWSRDEETGGLSPAGDRLIAHVVGGGTSLRKVDLGPIEDFIELVGAWRSAIGEGVGRGIGIDAAGSGNEAAGAELGERLLAPLLEDLGEDCTHLHICSDDLLFLVPIDALQLGDGRVGDRYRVVNEISFGRLIRPRPAAKGRGLLALGGASFGAALDETATVVGVRSAPVSVGEDRASSLSSFTSLANTLPEVEATAVLYEENAGGEALVLNGEAATKMAFRDAAPGKRFLHLATHGWFATETLPSMLDESGADVLWHRTSAEATVSGLAPSTLCGLAFAGANMGRDALGRVPGIMTAEELMGLDLSACELAVLSACETNVGIRRAGQGIQSLQSALHSAGARTAITSLWKVDDAATRKLMREFYTALWLDNAGKAEALWAAKCVLRAEDHPPRDWAGWVLTGSPD